MSIAQYLTRLARGVSAQGVLGPDKGGTGLTSPGITGNVLVSNGTAWVSQAGGAGGAGPTGPTGPAGPAGTDGVIGVDGAQGPTGPQGPASSLLLYNGTTPLTSSPTVINFTGAGVDAYVIGGEVTLTFSGGSGGGGGGGNAFASSLIFGL
jgi:hypothetical protein